MFSNEQIKIFREYDKTLDKYYDALDNGFTFQAAAWDIYCDKLLKEINDKGWEHLLIYYLMDTDNYDESRH